MGKSRFCYATPGTERHSSNYYGDSRICRFTKSQLASVIEMSAENWFRHMDGEHGTEPMPLTEVIDTVLGDMQFERPA